MEILNYNQKIAVMRVLLDIIHAEGRIDFLMTSKTRSFTSPL